MPALGVLAIVFHQVRTWPQTVRILKRRNAEGVSVLTWSLVLACNVTWFVYGIVFGDAVLVVNGVFTVAGAAAILLAMARHGAAAAGQVLWLALATVAFDLALYWLAGQAALGTFAVGIAMMMFAPQVIKVFRAPVSGISPMTWILILTSSVTWLAYGFASDQPAILVSHCVIFPCAVVVLARIAVCSRQLNARLVA